MASKLLTNTIIYAIGDIIPRLVSFIVFPILTRYLTPSDYGIVNYVNTIVLFFLMVSVLCLNTFYLVYYFKVGGEEAQKRLLGNLSVFIIGLNLLMTTLLLVLGFVYPALFSSNIDFYPYIALGVGTNFFNILTILPAALFRVQENPLPLTALNVAKGIITAGLTLVLVVFYNYTASGILWSTFIVSVVFGIIFLFITLKNMIFCFEWEQIKKGLRFSLPLLPGSLAYYALSVSDKLFIERYLDLTALGIYSTAVTLAMILNIITYGAYKAFEPYFFKTYGSDNFKTQFVFIQNIYLFVVLFGAMGLSMFAREFFTFFASDLYSEVYYYVPMAEISVVFISMSMLYGTIVTAREKTKISSLANIIGGCISVVLNIILLPYLGIIASCIASSLTTFTILAIVAYNAKLDISFIRPVLSLAIAITCVFVMVYIFSFDNVWISIGLKGVSLLCSLFVISRVLNIDHRKLYLQIKP